MEGYTKVVQKSLLKTEERGQELVYEPSVIKWLLNEEMFLVSSTDETADFLTKSVNT